MDRWEPSKKMPRAASDLFLAMNLDEEMEDPNPEHGPSPSSPEPQKASGSDSQPVAQSTDETSDNNYLNPMQSARVAQPNIIDLAPFLSQNTLNPGENIRLLQSLPSDQALIINPHFGQRRPTTASSRVSAISPHPCAPSTSRESVSSARLSGPSSSKTSFKSSDRNKKSSQDSSGFVKKIPFLDSPQTQHGDLNLDQTDLSTDLPHSSVSKTSKFSSTQSSYQSTPNPMSQAPETSNVQIPGLSDYGEQVTGHGLDDMDDVNKEVSTSARQQPTQISMSPASDPTIEVDIEPFMGQSPPIVEIRPTFEEVTGSLLPASTPEPTQPSEEIILSSTTSETETLSSGPSSSQPSTSHDDDSPVNCIRVGCTNMARSDPEWDGEFCSAKCAVLYCKTAFSNWVRSRETEADQK